MTQWHAVHMSLQMDFKYCMARPHLSVFWLAYLHVTCILIHIQYVYILRLWIILANFLMSIPCHAQQIRKPRKVSTSTRPSFWCTTCEAFFDFPFFAIWFQHHLNRKFQHHLNKFIKKKSFSASVYKNCRSEKKNHWVFLRRFLFFNGFRWHLPLPTVDA